MSNAICPARRLTEADAAQVCALMQGNPLFYRYHPPQPTPESIRTDMTALPPGKAMEDKWFVGFYDGDCLIAVMDLILNYPAADTAFIGLFMTAHDRQGCGLGSRILRDCMARLSAAGYHRLRLAVDEGNPQSLAFWTKNGFTLTGEVHPNDFSAYLPMERSILSSKPPGQGRRAFSSFFLYCSICPTTQRPSDQTAVMLWRWSIYMARSNRSRTVRGWLASVKSPSSTTMAWSRLPGAKPSPSPK